ncbi:MAG TPA: hypothetical protein VGG33_18875, partial [Polyangia bacterium]
APVFGRSSTLGFGQSSARSVVPTGRPSSGYRPTAILPARRISDTWFLKLVGASMVAAIAGAVWAGRLSWREHAIAAPAGPQHRPEIMAISGTEPPATETAGSKAVPPSAQTAPTGTPAPAAAPTPAAPAPATDAQPPVGNPTSPPAAGTTSATSSPTSTTAPAKPVAAPVRKKRARVGASSRRTANRIAHGRLR